MLTEFVTFLVLVAFKCVVHVMRHQNVTNSMGCLNVTNSTSYINITNSHTDGRTQADLCIPSECHELIELPTCHELIYRWRNKNGPLYLIIASSASGATVADKVPKPQM